MKLISWMLSSLVTGLGEVGYFAILLSIFVFSQATRIYFLLIWELILVGAFVWSIANWNPLGPTSRFFNAIIDNSRNPVKTKLYLHVIYSWLGVINSLALIYIGTVGSLHSFPDPAWGFIAGSAAILVIYYNRAAFNLFGQSYKDNRGASLSVSSCAARLAARMLVLKKRTGLTILRLSTITANTIFVYKRHRPKDLPSVSATLQDLEEMKELPYSQLRGLAEVMAELPDLHRIPSQFEKFLDETGWPRSFETLKAKHTSKGKFLQYLLAIVATIANFLVLVSSDKQQALYTALAGPTAQLGVGLTATFVVFAGFIYSFRTFTYYVPFTFVRWYGDHLQIDSKTIGRDFL